MIKTRTGMMFIVFGQLLLAGCRSRSDQPELGLVTGKVTMDDKPLGKALVAFGPSSGRPSTGVTDNDGNYKLQYLYDTPGAKIGSHKVVITTYYEDDASPEALNTKEKIPAKYNSKTTLTAEVKAGKNEINFPLQSK